MDDKQMNKSPSAQAAFPWGCQLFFWSFILVVSFILTNITIGIVCAAFDSTVSDKDRGSIFRDIRSSVLTACRPHTAEAQAVVGQPTAKPLASTHILASSVPSLHSGAEASSAAQNPEPAPAVAQSYEPTKVEEPIVWVADVDIEKTINAMFSRYDLDDSGKIDSREELYQLCYNVAYRLGLPSNKLQLMVTNVDTAQEEMDLNTFTEWFKVQWKGCT